MKRSVRCGGAVLVRVCVMGVTAAVGACGHTEAERVVVSQNAENASVLAGNIAALAGALRESSRVECGVVVARARERVAEDLVRIRAMIALARPTEAEVGDAGAAWVVALKGEVEALAARVMAAAAEDRAAVGRSLAHEHPATIDAAMGTAGFSVARVLRDAVEIDRVNETIEGEVNEHVRAGLMMRRATIVDPYMPVRAAVEATGRYREAVERYLAAVSEQAEIAGVHAAGLRSVASGGGAGRAVAGVLGNQDVREAVLGIVAREWGAGTAAEIRERLDRAQRALGGMER